MTVPQIIVVVALILFTQGGVMFIQWRFFWIKFSRLNERLNEKRWSEFISHYEERWHDFLRRYEESYNFDRDYRYHESDLRYIVESAQRDAQVELTWGARRMLIIPIIEMIERRGSVDFDQVNRSIRDIVKTISEEDRRPELPGRTRDSVSVIGGFWRRFCNIPPFCSRTEAQ